MNEDRRALDELRAEWVRAAEAGDLDAYVALLSEDVAWIPPHGPALTGRATVRAWLAPFLERWRYGMRIVPTRVRFAGELAVEEGAYRSRMVERETGEASRHDGRYVVLWRRGPDTWLIDRYVDTSPE